MSLFRKLERRDYTGGVFSNPDAFASGSFVNPYGLLPGAIPTNGMIDTIGGSHAIGMNTAMRNWVVMACVRTVSDTVSGLPIDAFTGDEKPVTPQPTKLVNPSAHATMVQWLWQATASLLLRGNVYGIISATDRLMYPSQVDILPPDCVRVEKDKAGNKVFYVDSGKPLSSEQIWHLPGPQMPGDLIGLSPISFAARTIGLGLSAEAFGADFFASGINPTAVLSTEQQVNATQAKDIKARIKQAVSGRDIAVLGAGMKLTPWQISAAESQFLETEHANAVAIAQIFGVPPERIGIGSSGRSTLTYANREQKAQDYLDSAVNPWLVRFEEALSAWFPRGTYIKFNTGALLRSDLLTRMQADEIAIRNNILLPSEARAFENYPPIPGLDDKPLRGDGAPTPPPPPPASPKSDPTQGK
jgi:HK97 family phage portal protein